MGNCSALVSWLESAKVLAMKQFLSFMHQAWRRFEARCGYSSPAVSIQEYASGSDAGESRESLGGTVHMTMRIAEMALAAFLIETCLSGGAAIAAEMDTGRATARSTTVKSCGHLTQTKISADPVGSSPSTSSTNSQTFVDLSGASVNIRVGGTRPSCVVVTFSAAASVGALTTERLNVRAVIGATAAIPDEVRFYQDGNSNGNFDGRTMQFLFPSVSPGTHTIKIQYKSIGGNYVGLSTPFIRVDYR